ncbi:SDR family oxidoreductase [Aureimonas leprariae]|uniref:SDR family oxidoreductase n=1 Tax=Plantimonas leprariae TaxID=2615207 RepID=A0A7V7TXX3_9HYPH|nr:SDR family oxidoreductase [Aureimonas leprariae]KAB0676303.1 SDR family oxidoreductase [Aureimonas leprariae]
MSAASSNPSIPTVLVVGASRGLGSALVAEFLRRGWNAVGTVRVEGARTELHELAEAHLGRVRIEALDIDAPDGIAALRERLAGQALDILFVSAGTTTQDEHTRVGAVATDEFMRVMVTNVLGPMRVIEALQDLVPTDGLVGAMSSGQGSIANNERGMREVYRASKAALNMSMRSFAARPENASRAMLLLAPGWIRTSLGGPDAPFTIEETVPSLVDVVLAKRGKPGIQYLDRFGQAVPW